MVSICWFELKNPIFFLFLKKVICTQVILHRCNHSQPCGQNPNKATEMRLKLEMALLALLGALAHASPHVQYANNFNDLKFNLNGNPERDCFTMYDYSLAQPGSEFEKRCTYDYNRKSSCRVSPELVRRLFQPVKINEIYNPIPKRIVVKYLCASKTQFNKKIKMKIFFLNFKHDEKLNFFLGETHFNMLKFFFKNFCPSVCASKTQFEKNKKKFFITYLWASKT